MVVIRNCIGHETNRKDGDTYNADHTDWLRQRIAEHLAFGWNRATLDLVGPSCVVAHQIDRRLDIAGGLRERLAVINSFQ